MATKTARETITTALRRIGVLSEMESPGSDQGNDALTELNDLMQGFPSKGIAYVHSTLTLDSVLNVPDEQTQNVMWMLAWELADQYGKEFTNKQMVSYSEAKNALQAAYYVMPLAQLDSGVENRLTHGSIINARNI